MSAVREVRGVARYRELFANDHAAALFAWSIVARLPLGMSALALILLVRNAGGDYAEAGLVTAAYGIAIGAPYAGRQVDRRGPRIVLSRRTIVSASRSMVRSTSATVSACASATRTPV